MYVGVKRVDLGFELWCMPSGSGSGFIHIFFSWAKEKGRSNKCASFRLSDKSRNVPKKDLVCRKKPQYTENEHLTHHPLDKMVIISQTIFADAFFANKAFYMLLKMSLKFVP